MRVRKPKYYYVILNEQRCNVDSSVEAYEEFSERVKSVPILVWKRTPFTIEQLSRLECELNGIDMWQFTQIDENFYGNELPRHIHQKWQYGEYIREEEKFRKAVRRQLADYKKKHPIVK